MKKKAESCVKDKPKKDKMRQVRMSDEVYEYIATQAIKFERPDDTLRRIFSLPVRK